MPVKLVQKTAYPESESTELRFELRSATKFTVYIRMPRWVPSPAEITVNDDLFLRSPSVASLPQFVVAGKITTAPSYVCLFLSAQNPWTSITLKPSRCCGVP